jgi:hypothetical protein
LLIPGVGAQGGDATATVKAGWRADVQGQTTGPICVNSSRAILTPAPKPTSPKPLAAWPKPPGKLCATRSRLEHVTVG